MAEHELNKIVDDDGEVFNLRDSTKQPTADRVTAWGSTPSDTKYPSEKLVKDSLDEKVSSIKKNGTSITPTNGVVDIGYMPTTKEVANGSVQDTIQALRVVPGGAMGSVNLTASTVDSMSIPAGWYNYIWIPHRTGQSSGDNGNYGTLILTPMTTTPDEYIVEGSALGGSSPVYRARRMEQMNNKVSSWSSTTNNTRYPSEKLVKDYVDNKSWFKNTSNAGMQNSNAYYQCISAPTADFSGLVKLYDVTEFFDGTIVNQNERSVFFGDVSLIRDGGNAGCKYARVCAMIGYNTASSNIILQSDDDNAYPVLVKEDFDRLEPTYTVGAYVITNNVATLDSTRTRAKFTIISCDGHSSFFFNGGFYNPSGYGLSDIKAYIFVDDSFNVLGNASGTNFDGYIDVPAGATKLIVHTNSWYYLSVGPTTTSPKYFLAMRYVAGWPAGTIEYFGRFYTRVTASTAYRARPLLLTYVQNIALTGTTYIPSGYVVQKTATYTTHSAVSDKLFTTRKLAVSLSNTSTDTSFDGSADVTNIKTTGTLDVEHGGTGNTSVDTAPTANSTKMVTSDGIKTALEGKVDFGLSNNSNIGTSAPAADCISYWGSDNIPNNHIKMVYNQPGNEATLIFSKRSTYGSIVKYGYADKYVYILRNQNGTWKSDNWEKISAGYADSAGTATKATKDSDGNAINATYFKSSGNTTLVAGAATKIGTQNGADVKLTLPTIPAAVSVKGNAESSYRTGQVNLTPANLGISATSTSVTVGSTTFNQYTHPTSAGNKHVPSGGSSGQFLGYGGSSGTATWTDLPKGYTTFSPSSETLRAYKRLAIGKTSVNLTSANSVKASFIVRIHVNYCDLGSNVTAEGMLITMMANVCFRTDQLAEMRLDAMGEARWDFEKIRPVLVSFSIQEDNITKYVVCLGFGDGTNGTTLKSFGYSYIDIMPITSDMGWEWIDGGDSTSTYDHITQMVRETGGRLGSSSGSSSLPVFVNSKGEFESVNAVDTANNMLKSLPGWTATPTDSTYLVRRDTGGAESFGQVQFSTVWAYIKGKMSSDPSGVLNGRVAGFTSNIWGTGAKRIALGYANMSSTDAWYNAIFLLKTGYNSTIGDGKSIAIMVSYCQRNSTMNVKSRVLVNNKWPLDLIPGVFTLETDNNTKLVVGFAVRDSSNNLVNLQYSEFNVIVLGKEENWTDQVTSDSVNGYNHFFETVQNPDIVVASTLPSTPEDNTLYFV